MTVFIVIVTVVIVTVVIVITFILRDCRVIRAFGSWFDSQ